MDEPLTQQSLKQRKILLAQSEHAPTVIELMKDLIKHTNLVGDNEYSTIVNAVTFDVQSQMLVDMVELLERIRMGGMHEPK